MPISHFINKANTSFEKLKQKEEREKKKKSQIHHKSHSFKWKSSFAHWDKILSLRKSTEIRRTAESRSTGAWGRSRGGRIILTERIREGWSITSTPEFSFISSFRMFTPSYTWRNPQNRDVRKRGKVGGIEINPIKRPWEKRRGRRYGCKNNVRWIGLPSTARSLFHRSMNSVSQSSLAIPISLQHLINAILRAAIWVQSSEGGEKIKLTKSESKISQQSKRGGKTEKWRKRQASIHLREQFQENDQHRWKGCALPKPLK